MKPNEGDDPIACFECGKPIHSLAERGSAVAEGIVLCERCCEQHERAGAGFTMQSWFDDLLDPVLR